MLLLELNKISGGEKLTKTSILFLGLLIILLTACSPNDKAEIKPPAEPSGTLSQELGKPQDLWVGVSKDDNITSVALGKYCWEEKEKTCNLEPGKPDELLRGHFSTTVKQGEKIDLRLTISDSTIPDELRTIDKIELIQFYKDEETPVEIVNNHFIAPEEPGRYYYSATLRWEGEIKGEANYAFSFSVQ